MAAPICWCAVCEAYVKYADMDVHDTVCVAVEEEYED